MNFNNELELNLIWAQTPENLIGQSRNDEFIIPWNVTNQSNDDLKRFKALTENNVCIMGYNTWKSLGYKPLKNRINIILTKEHFDTVKEQIKNNKTEKIYCCADVQSVLNLCYELKQQYKTKSFWVIGGAKIYQTFYDYATYFYQTMVMWYQEYFASYETVKDIYIPDLITDDLELVSIEKSAPFIYKVFKKYAY